MIASLYRIIAIGRNTLTEAVRQKVLSVLLVFAVVLVGCSVLVSQIATPGLDAIGLFDAQIKFVKDFGCGAIGLFGFFIAVLSTAQLIPQELHNRTVYTILAKPVRRSEFLLGKFLGVVLLVALCTAIMSAAFGLSLYWQEMRGLAYADAIYGGMAHNFPELVDKVHQYEAEAAVIQAGGGDSAIQMRKIEALNDKYRAQETNWEGAKNLVEDYDHDVRLIQEQIRDPQLIEAILLLFAKLIMTTGIALFISTFATSSIFTIITTFLIYLIGHLENIAREVWLQRGAEISIWQSGLAGLLSLLIPDMNSFTIVDEILAGNHIPWSHTLDLLGYAGVYLIVLLALSIAVFDYREI
ncbi:MAG TPA: ABC transporter permease subunit [Candidatus Methylacidiphilales bacterium]|nr:ABC transporter permease subunit [Candidatus Methylacidiphilales bacterium]